MSGSEPVWVDVSHFLACVTEEMEPNDLLHSEAFSLYDAMSAVEIGDPKMDAGLAGLDMPTADQFIDAGRAPTDLSFSQVIAVMDYLFRLEVGWQSGSSLAQTVFTSLYMLRPERCASNPALSAFCTALRATCCSSRSLVLCGAVCEDEDFMPYYFGLVSEGDATAGLNEVKAAVGLAQENLASLKGAGHAAADCIPAILTRLRFRKSLHLGLERVQLRSKHDLDAARKHFLAALGELDGMRATAALADPAGRDLGVEPDVNRRLLAPAPPRIPMVPSLPEAWDALQAMLAHLMAACGMAHVATLGQLQLALRDFSAALPGPVPRSVMHIVVSGKAPAPDAAKGNGAAAGKNGPGAACPPPWAPEPTMIAETLGVSYSAAPPAGALFLEQAATAMQGWCQAMCLNRARQRRRHRRAIEDWGLLFQHAANADADPAAKAWLAAAGWQPLTELGDDLQGVLATWVEKECCCVLLQHLLMGFELNLYLPAEFACVYWYCDYLYGATLATSKALFTSRPKEAEHAAVKKPAGKSKGRPSPKNDGDGPALHAQHAHLAETLQADVSRAMCQGLMRTAAGAAQLRALKQPNLLFNSEQQRFEQRFHALQHLVRPHPLFFEQYAEAMDTSGIEASHLFKMAAAGFAEARRRLGMLLRFPPVTAQVKSQVQEELQDGSMTMKWDFSSHSLFPIVSLKRK